ncbi:MAG: GPR endopeptidase [Clostridia bacterium]|nr:GPR endopeptidase [Clostridia bacterium]MBQ4323128.1 GPR endopeptidase [Clostridia bacterium]
MNLRTDLAVEAGEYRQLGEADGFLETVSAGEIPVSRVRIVNENAARLTGKPMGNYATVFFNGAFSDDELFDKAVDRTAEVLREFLKGAKNVLAVGLGNAEMTADALGPKVIDRLIISRHLKDQLPELYRELALGNLSALRPGVLGQTGIETAKLIRAAADAVNPDAILVFDALASRRVKRLCATVQISDTGITPGSGVGNHRSRIDRNSMEVPVISIGVPTVVDAATLAVDALQKIQDRMGEEGKAMASSWAEDEGQELREALGGYENNLVVTPQDIDALIERTAKLLSEATNMAVHGGLDREQIDALTGV